MAKCPNKVTSQSTLERTVAGYIKAGLLLSAVQMMELRNLKLNGTLLSTLRKYHPTSESLFRHLLRSNLGTPMATLLESTDSTHFIMSPRKSGRSTSGSGRRVSKRRPSGRIS